MDTTLAINPGSSSKKYAFFRNGREIFSVRFEHVGEGYGKCVATTGKTLVCDAIPQAAYTRGLYECLDIAQKAKVIDSTNCITHVGIRVVAPHNYLTTHRVIDARFRHTLESLRPVAPLHIPYLIEELDAVSHALPTTQLVGASDSAFHATMPTHASLYSVPEVDREQYHLYRFGYHGLSVASVVREVSVLGGSLPKRLIVIHAGSGVSITAVAHGKSIDTTMGFSPTSGLIMSSRGGDIDAAALLHLMRAKHFSVDEAEQYLSAATGLMGIAGTSDLRIILDRAKRGDRHARHAEEAYFYQIHKVLGSFTGILGGIDAIVLTGTAAERNPYVRARIAAGLLREGLVLDSDANDSLTERAGMISAHASTVQAYVIPTMEMAEIARIADQASHS